MIGVGRVDGRLRAISVFIVGMGFKHHIRLFFLPRIINFSSKCFMQITELQDGTHHSERLTNLFHCCNKYGFSKGNKNVVIPFSLHVAYPLLHPNTTHLLGILNWW